ncbi:MAG: hypothetical protein HY801_10565 [Candidatus Lindowbacteria bacterium]|nr:hypothetical protein [Candidatus Lindowbacteria bacterium]
MNAKYLLVLAVVAVVVGMALPAMAKQADLAAVIQNPQQFMGRNVTITAPIAQNMVPNGGEYRTWSFFLDSCGTLGGLEAVESGFNPETIENAYRLVEKAPLKGDKITVTGKVEESDTGFRLELASVRDADTQINTDEGPFVENYYGDEIYPGTPRFHMGRAYYGSDFPEVEPPPEHQRLARISGCKK